MCNKRLKQRDIMCFSCDWWKEMWASMLRHENVLRRLNISWFTGGTSELEKLLLHEKSFIELLSLIKRHLFFLLFHNRLFSYIHSKIRARTLALKCALAKIYASAETESVVEQNFELQFSSWREGHDNNGIPQHDVKMPTHLSKTRKQYVFLLWMLSIQIIPGRIGGGAGECVMNDNSSSKKFTSSPQNAGLL